MQRHAATISIAATMLLFGALVVSARDHRQPQAVDPGPRPGPAGAGGTFAVIDNTSATANAADLELFSQAQTRFEEVDSVTGTLTGNSGLGPTFNGDSCAMCHAFPAIGGTSPAVNPQVANNFAHLAGASNPEDLSGIITLNGPIREVRFVRNPNGTPDGGVHDLFTIAGRSDAGACPIAQPDFGAALRNNNAIFRIPTPLFGAGLVEMTSDATLEANLASTAAARAALGIGGEFNTSGNDGTITRFGWKAQNKSQLMFAGEAYNVEIGVTNELFTNERFPAGTSAATIAACTINPTPEDATNVLDPTTGLTTGSASDMSSDIVDFAAFARLLAPPTPTTSTTSEVHGQQLFSQVGCSLCHSPTLSTGQAAFPALSNLTYHPFSDFAVHHMGPGLADGITQGGAGPDQFRTAPLWGVGQRIFFLHDGRTSDLLTAIEDHASGFRWSASEANQVINNFNDLPTSDQQDILNFLRSL